MTRSPFRRITRNLFDGTRALVRQAWHCRRACTMALLLAVLLAAPLPADAVLTNYANAIDILGQFGGGLGSDATPHYTKACVNNGASKIGFNSPEGIVFDTVHHRLFVSDTLNDRVLVFTLNTDNTIASKTPANVLGQTDFTACAYGALTQSTMSLPTGLAYDSANDRLFVAEYGGHRVLVFDTAGISDGENAVNVLGQGDFAPHGYSTTQSTMSYPEQLAYDSANSRLFVADSGNSRVLVFDVASISDGENAVKVLGQADFTTGSSAVTQSGMDGPVGVALDSATNRLFVSDSVNNRVLVFDVAAITDGENAVNVLGQANFTSNAVATTQAGMDSPRHFAFDSTNNRLFVAEADNNRVLIFDVAAISDGENAANVLGQADFTSGGYATSQSTLDAPTGLAFDSTNNRLFVGEQDNNRVMIFDTASITDGENAIDLLGQYTSASSTATVTYTQGGDNNTIRGVTVLGFNSPGKALLDAVNHRLFVSDWANNRVLVYNLNTDNSFPDHTPDNVLGQANFTSNGGAATQSGMSGPVGLTFDSVNNRLFVAEYWNNRVLVFDTASISDGENAAKVLGQPDFLNNGGTTTQAGLRTPNDAAYDAVRNYLFVADSGNNRVLVFDVAAITDGENAINRLGQTNYTNNGAATAQARMSDPEGLAIDTVNNRLYVSEWGNNRVLVFDVATITNGENAINVLGQANFTSGGAATTQAGMNVAQGVDFDLTNNRLFVGNPYGNRVLVFDVATITNGENAVNILGQPTFTGSTARTTQNGFYTVSWVTYDPGSGRLFVGDWSNHRVMIFDASYLSSKFLIPGYE